VKGWRKLEWGSLAALGLGLVLRSFFVWIHPRFLGDALVYGDLAQNMLAHHVFGFSDDVIQPTLIRLPGYPLVLAACFLVFGAGNFIAVVWVQVVVDLLGCWLLAKLAGRLAGERVGRIVLWLGCLCPFTANYTAAALTETVTIFGVVVAFYAMERWVSAWRRGERGDGWALLVGVALMFSVEVRPDQGLLTAAVVPAMLWVGLFDTKGLAGRGMVERVRPALLASVVIVVVMGMWGVRNWRVFHVIQPLSPRYANDPGEAVPFGFQRWYRTWAVDFKATLDVYWNYDGGTLRMSDLPARAFDNAEQRAQTQAVVDAYNQKMNPTPAFDAAFARIAEERVRDNPFRFYVEMPLGRVVDMWVRPRTELMKLPVDWWDFGAHPWMSGGEVAYMGLDVLYLVFAGVGLVVWGRRRWGGQGALAAAMIGFVMLRCALLWTLDNSEPRYTLECFPAVILLAGMAWARIFGGGVVDSAG
jgi:hypothetical protein